MFFPFVIVICWLERDKENDDTEKDKQENSKPRGKDVVNREPGELSEDLRCHSANNM